MKNQGKLSAEICQVTMSPGVQVSHEFRRHRGSGVTGGQVSQGFRCHRGSGVTRQMPRCYWPTGSRQSSCIVTFMKMCHNMELYCIPWYSIVKRGRPWYVIVKRYRQWYTMFFHILCIVMYGTPWFSCFKTPWYFSMVICFKNHDIPWFIMIFGVVFAVST